MTFQSWGLYPDIRPVSTDLAGENGLARWFEQHREVIPYGNGRSYGDSALNRYIINCRPHHRFLDFDRDQGILHCQSGTLLSEIISALVPRGWFLEVTPGTKLITVGGAIASDVHGKNHHVAGCFSECVLGFRLMMPDGSVHTCSRTRNRALFLATCGGMGLTGVILDAKIRLKPINSRHICQTTIKTGNLKETFEAFENYKDSPYSVAWIDCLAKGDSLGRCLLMTGHFSRDGDLNFKETPRLTVPVTVPSFVLNRFSVKAFNRLYYAKAPGGTSYRKVGINSFFYPLDAIDHWNRIYGKRGFTQYQFILPKESSYDGLRDILARIAGADKGSFLAVLKLYGKANDNYLSFPMEGYSLALDFKIEKGWQTLLDALDRTVLKYGGRIYLAKDVRVSAQTFAAGYPMIKEFKKIRKQYGLDTRLNSLQSLRVEI